MTAKDQRIAIMKRRILLASKLHTDVVVVNKDTDVLVFMIWAFSKLNITKKWYLKYDHAKFVNAAKVMAY